jgi:hypothetical protein
MKYCFHLVALFGLHYPQQQFGLARPGQLRKHLNTMVACVEERASLSLFISQQIVHHTQSIDLSMALDIDCGATIESTAKHIWTVVASCGLASSLEDYFTMRCMSSSYICAQVANGSMCWLWRPVGNRVI